MNDNYYLVHKSVLPPVIEKVLLAKELLLMEPNINISDVCERLDLSRSSYYKYKDLVYPMQENTNGAKANIAMDLNDVQGVLSQVLSTFSLLGTNIITINQSMPIKGKANVNIVCELGKCNIDDLLAKINIINGVVRVKLLAVE